MSAPYLVASPRLAESDLVLRWRAWKRGLGDAPFDRAASRGREHLVSEHDLCWLMLEIERLRAAIEGLVKTGGGRQ